MDNNYAQLKAFQLKLLQQEPTLKPDYTKIENLYTAILEELGFNVKSEGLLETPNRVARFWKEFVEYEAGNIETTFEAVQTDQMVIVKDIPFYSLCEHHLLPFYGTASVAYITGEKVIGLSKIPRIVKKAASTLQLQERLANDIIEALETVIPDNQGLAVILKGAHMCMRMRGIQSEGEMITSLLKGAFKEEHDTRLELLSLLKG